MNQGSPGVRALAERKAHLVAASDRARRDLVAKLPAGGGLERSASRIASTASVLIRQPFVIGAAVFLLAVVGPRRIFGALRWVAVALPLHPLGRRVMSLLGARLLDLLSPGPSARPPGDTRGRSGY